MVVSGRRAEALLAATSVGSTALMLGHGCERLDQVVPCLGGRVVDAAFGPPGRTTDGTGASPDDRLRVHTTLDTGLPFADESFDSVFAPRLLAFAAEPGRETDGVRRMLRECARVLKPGGRLVIWVPNGSVVGGILRRAQRWRSSVQRSLSRRATGAVRAAPDAGGARRDGGWSPGRLESLLQEAGFRSGTLYLPWPRADTWRALIPLAVVADYALPRASTLGERVLRMLWDVSRRLGAYTWPVPEYCMAATRADEPRAAGPRAVEPVLHRMLRETGASPADADRVVLNARGERVVTFAVRDSFFKVPVSPAWGARLRHEVDGNTRAQATPAHHFMVVARQQGTLGELPYAVFPTAEIPSYRSEAEKVAALEETFARLAAGAEDEVLHRSDAWSRIFAPQSFERLVSVGGAEILARLRDACATKCCVTGLSHGDLHLDNILRREGDIALIDWDRFEARSPLVLDRFNAVNRLLLRTPASGAGEPLYLVVLRTMARREITVPLLQRIDEVAGELSWGEVIGLYALSAASWRLSQAPSTSLASAEEEVRNQIEVVLSCWQGRL